MRSKRSTSLANDLNKFKDSSSTADDDGSKSNPINQVVIVMDGLEEFTTKPLQWALKNLATSSNCVFTLLGFMPWLNIPLSTKTWLDVWSVELEEVMALLRHKNEYIKSDFKYLKLKEVIDLCKSCGVVPQKKVVMGYPLRLLVLEQIRSLNATWVVFDRHERNTRFYANKIQSNMVRIKEDGMADMIKGQLGFRSGLGSSSLGTFPLSLPIPMLMISDQFKRILKKRSRPKYDTIHEEEEDEEKYDNENEVFLSV